jgi:hypothetical protein
MTDETVVITLIFPPQLEAFIYSLAFIAGRDAALAAQDKGDDE